ncbi:MAG: ribosome rescue GTPase HflX [Acidiferrobacter sp.]
MDVDGRERAILVHLRLSNADEQEDLEEFKLLALSAGAEVAGVVEGARNHPDSATYVGSGKAEEIRELVAATQAEVVLVNGALSPGQERNLEKAVAARVLDRTGLILDIFAQRAQSHEGKLQVQLAQLEHLSTRLVRGWTHLERQKGGIGLRGPGETQLESDRRMIGERIRMLHKRLDKVHKQRVERRRARARSVVPTVSLVGYTNAGKSSLFNALTGAGIYVADRLFATLDPTMRRVELPGSGAMILADTVGFIRHLPHGLVAAFRSTLEEVKFADLLIHVVDASHPEHQEYKEQVERVLAEIGADSVPRLTVMNKIDIKNDPPRAELDSIGDKSRVFVSAKTGAGIDILMDVLSKRLAPQKVRAVVRLPIGEGRLRSHLYSSGTVLTETVEGNDLVVTIELSREQCRWLAEEQGMETTFLPGAPAAQDHAHSP